MISRLFKLYRASPFWLREGISRATGPLRLMMRPFSKLDMSNYTMVVDFDDNASFKYYTDRERYEYAEVTAFLAAICLCPGCVVVDVGANYGPFSLAAGQLAKLGVVSRILAIEPDRRPFKALCRSLEINGYDRFARAFQAIVGDSPGTETIFVNARSSADNRSHEVRSSPIRVRDSYEVECLTLDALFEREGVDANAPVVLKMDIQGNEPRALGGAEGVLNRTCWVLFFEHAPYLVESAGIDLAQYEERLCSLGADHMFEIRERRLVPLRDEAALREVFARLARSETSKMQGVGTNFVFAKGVEAASLAELDFGL